jgi:hypothetical protein
VIRRERIARDPPDTVTLAVIDDEAPSGVDDRLATAHRCGSRRVVAFGGSKTAVPF